MEPSSSNKGFFQPRPVLGNQFYDDIYLQRVAQRKSDINTRDGSPGEPVLTTRQACMAFTNT
jgi:hypothetical protein